MITCIMTCFLNILKIRTSPIQASREHSQVKLNSQHFPLQSCTPAPETPTAHTGK